MPASFPTLRLRHIAGIAVTAGVLTIGANWLQSDQGQQSASSAAELAAAPVFGPGGRIDVGALTPERLTRSGVTLPAAIAAAAFATEERELVVNAGLLQVFDFFLLEAPQGNGADASAALSAFLASRLTNASVVRAMQIAADYRAYMAQHDALLAAQNFDHRSLTLATLDAGRVRTWMQLRQRLRESVLGAAVSDAWYQNDDAQLLHVLDELQQAPNADAFDEANRRSMQGIIEHAARRFAGHPDHAVPRSG